jgi:hypothetical protein
MLTHLCSWLGKEHSCVSRIMAARCARCANNTRTTVIDECLAQRKPGDCSAVLMFFFQSQEDTALSFFESLTKQLIAALINAGTTCSPEVLSNLEEAYGREVSRPDIAQVVYDLVVPLCLSFHKITLVVDGIDECKTAESSLVWQWLDKILKEVFVKLLVTSEGWAKIPLPNEEFHRIRVDQNNNTDIDAYIHEQISSRSGTGQIFGDEKLQAEVRADLQEKADGMFVIAFFLIIVSAFLIVIGFFGSTWCCKSSWKTVIPLTR